MGNVVKSCGEVTLIGLNALLSGEQLWFRTRVKSHILHARIPSFGTKILNIVDGIEYYTQTGSEVVLKGTCGEQSVVSLDYLLNNYTLANGASITRSYIERKLFKGTYFDIKPKVYDAYDTWAFHIPASVQGRIVTPAGQSLVLNSGVADLPHNMGDFIIASDLHGEPNRNCMRVVNGCIFKNTYDTSHM